MMYLQMVNTRRNNQGGEQLQPPPPITMEQLMMMQTQLLQQMAQSVQNYGNGNGNAPPQVRDKRGEFLKRHPLVGVQDYQEDVSQLESLWHIALKNLLYVIIWLMSKTCDNYVMRLCDVIKYFTLILLQFEIICVFGHPGRTYMSTWFCYAKLGATNWYQSYN